MIAELQRGHKKGKPGPGTKSKGSKKKQRKKSAKKQKEE